jgi:hypothetical protein
MTPNGFESGQRPRAPVTEPSSSTAQHSHDVFEARWLLWLVGRTTGFFLAVQQQCLPNQASIVDVAEGNAETRIHNAHRALRHVSRYCIPPPLTHI